MKPHVGERGLPDPWPGGPDLGAGELVGIDLWQANNFVVHRRETAEFLFGVYTPTKVNYKAGTFPVLEEIVARHAAGAALDRDRAVNLLTKGMPALSRHPALPPYKSLRVDRNFDEEQSSAAARLGATSRSGCSSGCARWLASPPAWSTCSTPTARTATRSPSSTPRPLVHG